MISCEGFGHCVHQDPVVEVTGRKKHTKILSPMNGAEITPEYGIILIYSLGAFE
jgi:hypothetical protein